MYDSISIDTTQNVSINLVKASLGDRLLAFIIDVIIKIVYILALVLVAVLIFDTKSLFNGNESESQIIAIIVLLILLYLPVFLYDVLFEILMDGQTPGKKVMKIKSSIGFSYCLVLVCLQLDFEVI
jgi:uncharacterized RDD family membrane protein YckC